MPHKNECDKIKEKESAVNKKCRYETYAGINRGDKDIDKRVVKTLEQLCNEASASIQQSCGDKHQSKAVYRLLSNKKFQPEEVTRASAEESIANLMSSGCEIMLVIQDTSVLCYSHLRASSEMGVIGLNEKSRGLFLHSARHKQ